MALFLKDESLVDTLPCDNSLFILSLLYLLLGSLSIFALLTYLIIAYKKGWIRFLPIIVCMVLNVSFAFIRVQNENALFGHDISFTILFAISTWLLEIQGAIQSVKLMEYLLKRFPLLAREQLVEIRLTRSYQFFIVYVFSASMSAICIFCLPFFRFQEVALVLIRMMLTLQVFNASLLYYMGRYNFGLLRKDIRILLRGQHNYIELDMETKIDLRRMSPKLKNQGSVLWKTNIIKILFLVPAIFLEYPLTWWKYVLPLNHIMWTGAVIGIALPYLRIYFNKSKRFGRIVSYKDLLE